MEYDADPNWETHIGELKAEHLAAVVGRVKVAAEAAAPVDTGAMLASVYSEIDGDTGRVGSPLYYALYVEDGHRVAYRGADGEIHYTGDVVPPQPWLRPALYSEGGG